MIDPMSRVEQHPYGRFTVNTDPIEINVPQMPPAQQPITSRIRGMIQKLRGQVPQQVVPAPAPPPPPPQPKSVLKRQ